MNNETHARAKHLNVLVGAQHARPQFEGICT